MRFKDFIKLNLGATLLITFFPMLVLAQTEVVSVTPRANEINAAINTAIQVTFSRDLNVNSLNPASFVVRGNQTGVYPGTLAYDATSRTAQFTANTVFKEGELITVTLTSGITDASGSPLTPFQWSFTAAVEYGTGVFEERIEIALQETQRDPAALTSGDFNNDLFPDLAVVNGGSNSVSILMNQFFVVGSSFSNQGSVAVGAGPNAIAGGDFNNDGWLDLAVSNFDDNSISILSNLGDGNFARSQTIATLEHPTALGAHDFDNDGSLDLAAAILGVNRLQIFRNTGSGSFTEAGEYTTGPSPFSLTGGDFDNDGDADVVVTNSGDNTIIVYRNDGQAQFANSGVVSVPDFPTKVRTNDLIGRTLADYGDRFLDLILVHPNINSISIMENRSRDGGFVLAQELQVGTRPADVFLADIDTSDATALSTGFGKDHDIDATVPNLLSQNLNGLRNEFNNGFSNDLNDVYAAGETPNSVTGADFDKDGDIDLAVTNLTTQQVTVLLNQGGPGGGLRFTDAAVGLDFGQVYVGTDSTRTFSLLNPTNETVTIDNISNTLPVFSATSPQTVIGPGQIRNFSVTFAPTDTLVYQDSLVVSTTSGGVPEELTVGLTGEGILSSMAIIPDTLEFGDIQPPQTATLPIEIISNGNGPLLISDMQFTDPDFSAAQTQLTVPGHESRQVDITFAPSIAFAYLDTLTVFSNDSSNSQASVILLGGPNNYPPVITSADTVTATEDVFFQYVATASDSDGTQPRFAFRDLPGWMGPTSSNPGNSSVEGTPGEGDLDTTFSVIATDGIFSDTLEVFVDVIPVNDAPVILSVSDQTVPELTPLSFTLTAVDPEDSTLAFSAINLPAGATLTDNGNRTARFAWTPPTGSRGVYNVTFVVAEAFEDPALTDSAEVRITVLQALPDLTVASLGIDDTDIALDQTHVITGVARSETAPATSPFRLTFLHDGIVARDTVVNSLGAGDEIAFNYVATFTRLGDHNIVFEIDRGQQVLESDEENNSANLLLNVSKASLVVRPNPFTPNQDGFNDRAVFDFSDLVLQQPELKIFSFRGALLTTLRAAQASRFEWDGRDDDGREQKPGLYLYVLLDDSKRITGGYIALAR